MSTLEIPTLPLPVKMGGINLAASISMFLISKHTNQAILNTLIHIKEELDNIEQELTALNAEVEWSQIIIQIDESVQYINNQYAILIEKQDPTNGWNSWATNVLNEGSNNSIQEHLRKIHSAMIADNPISQLTVIQTAINLYKSDIKLLYPYEQVVSIQRYMELVQTKGYFVLSTAYQYLYPEKNYHDIMTLLQPFASNISDQIAYNQPFANDLLNETQGWTSVYSESYGSFSDGSLWLASNPIQIHVDQDNTLAKTSSISITPDSSNNWQVTTTYSYDNTDTTISATGGNNNCNLNDTDTYFNTVDVICDEGYVVTGIQPYSFYNGGKTYCGINIIQSKYTADFNTIVTNPGNSMQLTNFEQFPFPMEEEDGAGFWSETAFISIGDTPKFSTPKLLKGLRIAPSKNFNNRAVIEMLPLTSDFGVDRHNCLKEVLLANQWHPAEQLETMKLYEMRNCLIVSLGTVTSIRDWQNFDNWDLAGIANLYQWIHKIGFYTDDEILKMNEYDIRNVANTHIGDYKAAGKTTHNIPSDYQQKSYQELVAIIYENAIP